MGLQQVNKAVLSSAASEIIVTGINSDDPYVLVLKNIQPVNNIVYPKLRLTESGTANTTLNYDFSYYVLKAAVGFANYNNTNQDKFLIQSEQLGNVTQEKLSGVFYISMANSSSDNTHITFKTTSMDSNSNHLGIRGSGVFTVNSSVDGVSLVMSSGNVEAGAELVLYKVI